MGLNYEKNFLHMEGVNVKELASEFITPFYCYSKKVLLANYGELKKALPRAEICYAVKANSNMAIVKLLAEQGCGADVTSRGELMLALKCGIPAEKIVFNGVGKTINALTLAMQYGVKQINIESEEELDTINQIGIKTLTRANIGIRINPDVDAKTNKKITTGKAENKFGVAWPEALRLYKKAFQMNGVMIKGISIHIGSQIMSLKPFEQAFKKLAKWIDQLEKEHIIIKNIDLGGGLGVVYNYKKDKAVAAKDYAKLIDTYFKRFKKNIIVEPGRRLVANAGVLVSKVLYNKNIGSKKILVIDAGMNDFMRPALYHDAWHEILPCIKWNRPVNKVDIVGDVCESSDIFGRERLLPELKRGEFVAIMGAGAYGSSMSSIYNYHPLAPEVLVEGKVFRVIRRRKTYEEMLDEQLDDIKYGLKK
ncbi:MAG: diaminopimelate decarboxylase [Elusimicrobiota bacterium]|jgi:diaminopimelate decarboxylase|nr:diaminopimelate decarboxylase [Elusimicrobiota bacterium]